MFIHQLPMGMQESETGLSHLKFSLDELQRTKKKTHNLTSATYPGPVCIWLSRSTHDRLCLQLIRGLSVSGGSGLYTWTGSVRAAFCSSTTHSFPESCVERRPLHQQRARGPDRKTDTTRLPWCPPSLFLASSLFFKPLRPRTLHMTDHYCNILLRLATTHGSHLHTGTHTLNSGSSFITNAAFFTWEETFPKAFMLRRQYLRRLCQSLIEKYFFTTKLARN